MGFSIFNINTEYIIVFLSKKKTKTTIHIYLSLSGSLMTDYKIRQDFHRIIQQPASWLKEKLFYITFRKAISAAILADTYFQSFKRFENMFKVNNKNTRTSCEICSKLTMKTPERRHWRRSSVFIVNSEHISHLIPVFLLLTLSRYMLAGNNLLKNYYSLIL